MERAGAPRHTSQNPRGEGTRARIERIKSFEVDFIEWLDADVVVTAGRGRPATSDKKDQRNGKEDQSNRKNNTSNQNGKKGLPGASTACAVPLTNTPKKAKACPRGRKRKQMTRTRPQTAR